MRMGAYFCDLCAGDGEVKLAVARYWNDEGQEWHCCAKHLRQIEASGLRTERFSERGDIDLARFGY